MWMTTIGIVAGLAVLVAALMEPIKIKCFKDEAKQGQMRALGYTLSLLGTVLGYISFDMLGKWPVVMLYSMAVYVVQKQVDMKLIRPKLKEFALRKLEKM